MATKSAARRPPAKLKSALQAAVCHPLRLRVFTALAEREGSPSQLARRFGDAVGNVNYHIKALEKWGLVEEVGSRPVRGTIEHFYKATELPYVTSEQEAELPMPVRRSMTETAVALYAGDAAHSLAETTLLARRDHHLTRTTLYVDEQGWSEIAEAYGGLYERVVEIQADSAQRMGESDEVPIRALSYQSFFELPPISEPDSDGVIAT